MNGLGEDVYIDRSAALDELTAESQRLGLYGDAPDNAVEAMVEAAAIRLFRERWAIDPDFGDESYIASMQFCRTMASAALESLGIPLSVLAAIRAGEWQAVPKDATDEMLAAARQYDYAGMVVHDPDQDDWAAHLSAAPKTPEEAR